MTAPRAGRIAGHASTSLPSPMAPQSSSPPHPRANRSPTTSHEPAGKEHKSWRKQVRPTSAGIPRLADSLPRCRSPSVFNSLYAFGAAIPCVRHDYSVRAELGYDPKQHRPKVAPVPNETISEQNHNRESIMRKSKNSASEPADEVNAPQPHGALARNSFVWGVMGIA